MSHIHLTGIAKARQLNFPAGRASTLSAIHDIDTSTDALFLLLQEPWLDNTRRPPTAVNYDLFYPTGDNPRCTTYIRKDIDLRRRTSGQYNQCIIATTITLPELTLEIINIYVPSGNEANGFLANYHPSQNVFMAMDFDSHYTIWYTEEVVGRHSMIVNNGTETTKLIEYTQEHNFCHGFR